MATNPYDLTDEDCAALMTALDEMDYSLRDRDAGFVESNLGRGGHFTDPQKKWCANLVDRYDSHLLKDWRTFYAPKPQSAPAPQQTEEDDMLGSALT